MTRARLGLLVENDAPFVFEEAQALRAAGVDVRVCAVFRPHPAERWEERFGAPVAYPRRGVAAWAGAVLPGARRPDRLAALLAQARAEGAPARLVALAAAVAVRARREAWTHLHASFATFPAFVAAGAARLAARPWSFTAHAYDVQEPRPWLPRLLRETSFARAISGETAARLASQAPDAAARVRVGHLGVDETRFAPRARAPQADAGPPRLVAVANPGPTKGLEDLVDAVALLRRDGVACELEVLGEGPGRAALAERVAAAGLAERVRLRGAGDREAVAEALRDATLFALPCVALPPGPGRPSGRHDGLPVAILEAMATALPVVTTPVGGIPDAVAHDETGWLVPPGDPGALARALRALLADPARRARLGASARRAVLARFRLADAAERLAAWIDEAGRATAPGGRDAAASPSPRPPGEVAA